jgi:hypothetical protein
MKLKLTSTLAMLAATIVFSGTLAAQSNYRGSNDSSADVTIYADCDFSGKSQTLRPGEYRNMRDAGFDNDSVSSIRVPRGTEVTIYQDDKYRGSFARIDNDIRCFDRQWDDKVSSLSISDFDSRDRRNGGSRNNGDRNDRYNDQAYDGRSYDNRNDRSSRGNNGQQNNPNVTAKNVSQVIFDGISLQQVADKQWSMDRARGASKQFDETRRNRDSVYLENKFTAERIRIDLFANDVTVVGRDGRQQRYGIDRKNAASGPNNNSAQRPVASAPTSSQNRRIRANCFDFKAYTKGGNASVRFHGKDNLYRFNNKASTGRICHNGVLTMEIGKTVQGTNVTVEINGNRYTFVAGEKEDKYLNNWYRKSVKLVVGK